MRAGCAASTTWTGHSRLAASIPPGAHSVVGEQPPHTDKSAATPRPVTRPHPRSTKPRPPNAL